MPNLNLNPHLYPPREDVTFGLGWLYHSMASRLAASKARRYWKRARRYYRACIAAPQTGTLARRAAERNLGRCRAVLRGVRDG